MDGSRSFLESKWRVYLIFLAPLILLPFTWQIFEGFGVNTNSEIRVQFQTYSIVFPFIFVFFANHPAASSCPAQNNFSPSGRLLVYGVVGFGMLVAYVQLQISPNMKILSNGLDPIISLFLFGLGTYLFSKPLAEFFRLFVKIDEDGDRSMEDAQILDYSSKTQQIISPNLITEPDFKDIEERFFVQIRELIDSLETISYLERPDFRELKDRNKVKTEQLYKRLSTNYGWPTTGDEFTKVLKDLTLYYERNHANLDLDALVKSTMSLSSGTNGVFLRSRGELFRFLYVLTGTKPESAYMTSSENDLLGMFVSQTTAKRAKPLQKKIGLIFLILSGVWRSKYSELELDGTFTRNFSDDVHDLFVDLSTELGLLEYKLPYQGVFSPDNLDDLISTEWTSISESMQKYIDVTRDVYTIAKPSVPELIQTAQGNNAYIQDIKSEFIEKFNALYEG